MIPAFSAAITAVSGPGEVAASWREGCPVHWSELSRIDMPYVEVDGDIQSGSLIVAGAHAEAVVEVFAALFAVEFPIARMQPIDDFGGDDLASMAANNTSGFNCRRILGTDEWSQHALGAAVDVNPLVNPYVLDDGTVLPTGSEAYLDRSADVPGLITADGPVVEAFAGIGWGWGGAWDDPPDYQHFSATGG